jgi:alpha-soluble NSF attachment protein
VKEYFLQAGLCHICTKVKSIPLTSYVSHYAGTHNNNLLMQDYVASRKQLEKYADAHIAFDITREYELLKSIIKDAEEDDVDAFTQHVFDYDKLSKLDNWKTTMLLRIKRSLSHEEVNLR